LTNYFKHAIIKNVKEPLPKAKEVKMENRVEEFRKQMGLKQDEFAQAIKVSRQTVSSIENGKYNPSLELAFTIADFFDKSIEEIFIHQKRKEQNENE
jgi:putative transcriptional regulator